MTALIAKPNAMKKVQAEIREFVGKKSIVNEEDIQNLPYFKLVIKETFRLYPTTTLLLPRETMQNSILEGYEIKPKTIIYVNVWAIARDPEIWENPEEFIPERFLNSDIDFKGQNFELLPFGAGRRGCPAIALGVATVELVLSNLLYAFDWELPRGMNKEDIDTDVLPGLTMHKKKPLCLVSRNYH
uniref:Cytochrome P450 n=2 Tax=Solanum tuberosum TaxID=4113 RepID=M1DG84_SOLTU